VLSRVDRPPNKTSCCTAGCKAGRMYTVTTCINGNGRAAGLVGWEGNQPNRPQPCRVTKPTVTGTNAVCQ
jgi:hypothetical protein